MAKKKTKSSKKNARKAVSILKLTNKFKKNVKSCIKFVEANKRLPNKIIPKNEEERYLGFFIKNSKQQCKDGKRCEEAIDLLCSIPGFTLESQYQGQFETNVNKCKEFVKLHNRLPSMRCEDNESEKRLGIFLVNHKIRTNSHSQAQARIDLLREIPGFSFDSRGEKNQKKYGTTDPILIKKQKRQEKRDDVAKAKAELSNQQAVAATSSVSQYFVRAEQKAKQHHDFNKLKEETEYVCLGHSSLVKTEVFETTSDRKKKLKPYNDLSRKTQQLVNHQHMSPPKHVYAHGIATGATVWAANHWHKAHRAHIRENGHLTTLSDGRVVCVVKVELHFIFPWQSDFHKFNQVRCSSNNVILNHLDLLTRCCDPVASGAVLELTFHVPRKSGMPRKGQYSPDLFHMHRAVNKRWKHLDGNLDARVDLPFDDQRVVALPIGIMSRGMFEKFYASHTPVPVDIFSPADSDNDNDNDDDDATDNDNDNNDATNNENDSDNDDVATVDELEMIEADADIAMAIQCSLMPDDDRADDGDGDDDTDLALAMTISAEVSNIKETHIAGIENLGNTCYLSASLQTLYSIPQFLQKLYRCYAELSEKKDLPLTRALLEVAVTIGALKESDALMISSNKARSTLPNSNSANPSALKKQMDQLTDKFAGYEQHDAHEFLGDLIDFVHDELADDGKLNSEDAADETAAAAAAAAVVTTDLPTDEYFHLKVRVCLECKSCGYSRSKEEQYRHLSVDVGEADGESWGVKRSLELFFESEDLKVKCEKCEHGTCATQTKEVISQPKAILLHFKRFIVTQKDNREMVLQKNKAKIPLEDSLSLSSFFSPEDERPNGLYHLRGVVNHVGSTAFCGHYTACSLRRTNTNSTESDNTNWVFSNDRVCNERTQLFFDEPNNQEQFYLAVYAQEENSNTNEISVTGTEESSADEIARNDESTNEVSPNVYGTDVYVTDHNASSMDEEEYGYSASTDTDGEVSLAVAAANAVKDTNDECISPRQGTLISHHSQNDAESTLDDDSEVKKLFDDSTKEIQVPICHKGEIINISCSPKTTIRDVKQLVSNQKQYIVDRLRLICQGRQLEDDTTLEDLGVGRPRFRLHLLLRSTNAIHNNTVSRDDSIEVWDFIDLSNDEIQKPFRTDTNNQSLSSRSNRQRSRFSGRQSNQDRRSGRNKTEAISLDDDTDVVNEKRKQNNQSRNNSKRNIEDKNKSSKKKSNVVDLLDDDEVVELVKTGGSKRSCQSNDVNSSDAERILALWNAVNEKLREYRGILGTESNQDSINQLNNDIEKLKTWKSRYETMMDNSF